MERQMDSMSKSLSPQATENEYSPEESGWTMYFEDFLAENKEHSSSLSCNYGYGSSSSMVSDAASSSGKKTVCNDHVAVLSSLEKSCKKLSFKKRKSTKKALVDDSLADTASSPVTSPKVYDLRRLDMMNPEEKATDISKEKGRSYRQTNERGNEVGFIGRDSDCTELKKRGLCLVPLSMIVHHLG